MKGAISKSKRRDLPLETHLEAFTEAILNASNFLLNPLTSSKNFRREFPGSTEVRTPHFHCLAVSIPGRGIKILPATWHGQKTKLN